MDLLPLIPKTLGGQNVASTIRESFQDTLDGLLYPKDIADNIVRYNADTDIKFKRNACNVIEIHKKLNHKLGEAQDAAHSIMFQQADYEVKIDKIESVYDIKERTRLKHCKLFQVLKARDVERFGLLQMCDLLPDVFSHFLDYRLNDTLHLCESCINMENKKQETKRKVENVTSRTYEIEEDKKFGFKLDPGKGEFLGSKKNASKVDELGSGDDKILQKTQFLEAGPYKNKIQAFTVEPRSVVFHNCDIGITYQRTVKLINTSRHIQSINVGRLPRRPCFSVHLNLNYRIAPGMSVIARIFYKPLVYRNMQDCFSFRNNDGDYVTVNITATREPPRLITLLFHSHRNLFEKTMPGSNRFLEKRRIALNSTIDCGTCLIGQYVLLSMFLENVGSNGKFFIITEDEWYNQNIEKISASMELSSKNIWIYPTFFELSTGEITEINIMFHPFEPGLHVEKYYVICDNNSLEQLEILGDALEFNMNMIKIDVVPNDTEIERKENYCVFLGNVRPYNPISLTICVHNTSSLRLDCYYTFQHNPFNDRVHDIHESWINILTTNKTLAPYSSTDFDFEITLNTVDMGYHNIFFSFFILNVPIVSLCEDQEFTILQNEEISGRILTKSVDIEIVKMEICCFVDALQKSETSLTESCPCVDTKPPRMQKMEFCSLFLEFGILPSGLNVQKVISIRNLGYDPIKWEIVEVKYNIDTPPYMEILTKPNFRPNTGEFSCLCDSEEISYVTHKEPISWASILLLMSKNKDDNKVIESMCVVTYEVIDYDITINTNNTDAPILCPLKLLYVGMPTTLQFSIENNSLITGAFYFLTPYGDDLDKVEITLEPSFGTLNPMENKEITATITCKEIGIVENIFVPCFIGAGQDPIILRVLLAVDGVHVIFYLPEGRKRFEKVLWPPNIVYEFDEDWMFCPCILEQSPEFLDDIDFYSKQGSEKSTILSEPPFVDQDSYKSEMENIHLPSKSGELTPNQINHEESESTEVELLVSSHTIISTPTVSSCDINLKNILRDKFGQELCLQDYVAEMHRVAVKTATKFTFYFENNTPVETTYTVEAMNFYADKKFDETAFKLKQKTIDEIWSDMIINELGVVVQPEVDCGDIPVTGLIEVNVWVYANTWGVYMEEIAVDIPDMISFTFSLLIQVVGSPIMIPLALNSITEYPTIRFGKVPYRSPEITRKIKIDNISGIPVHILWHTFLRSSDNLKTKNKFNWVLDLVDKMYYPQERRLLLTKRDTDEDFIQVEMEMLATLELPALTLDFICGETQIFIYANDVIFDKGSIKHVRLLFQNKNSTPVEVEVEIEEPFKILRIENGKRSKRSCCVKPLGCLEVLISINLDHQKILDLSKSLYNVSTSSSSTDDEIVTIDKIVQASVEHTIDKLNNKIHIKKDFIIRQHGVSKLTFPVDLHIYFPNIMVKPTSVKFQNVMVGHTSKTLVSVFNLTGCLVKYEIYKSVASDEIFVTPHYGEIPKSTGVNKQFVDIFVYFKPRAVKQYQESIRVVTNIPNYYIEIPVKGYGSVNEKYQVDYKI